MTKRHDLIERRNKWLQGQSPGPTMLVGKFIRGQPDSGTPNEIATTPAGATQLVNRAWSLDYDFIEIYRRPVFAAWIESDELDVQSVRVYRLAEAHR